MSQLPGSRSAFWQGILRIQREKVDPAIGWRNALGVVLPLAIGNLMGAVPGGLVMAMGALNAAFSDSHAPYIQRARRMAAASLLVACGVVAGTLCAWNTAFLLLASSAWAFAAGMLVALDTTAADLGAVSLITLLVFARFPQAPQKAFLAGLLALAGGLIQTALAIALWPLRRYTPERRALGDLFVGLAASASGSIRPMEAPPVSAQTTNAQTSLTSLDRDHSVEAERYRALLSQGERIRLGLFVLARLRMRLERAGEPVQDIDRFIENAAGILRDLARVLLDDDASNPTALLDEQRDLAERLRPVAGATARNARHQMDALAGQFRAAWELAGNAMPRQASEFDRREAARSWPLRLQGTWATLRANLSLESAACRHAIRLAVCVGLGEAAGLALELRRSYWLPMTVAIVLKSDFTSTFSRGVLRLAGTFAGLLLATALFHVLPPASGLEVVLIGVFTFIVRSAGPANYGILTTAVTALVVLLLALSGTPPNSVMLPRALNTAIGGGLALAAYWLWPTWERTQVPDAMARTLDSYRAYFQVLRLAYEQPGQSYSAELDRTRLAARRARSNLEASVDRLAAEPGSSPEQIRVLGGFLANSHRLVHAFMALEAGLSTSHPASARPAFRNFADQVELTLYYLSAALRGSPLEPQALPDLREAHHPLVRPEQSLTARQTLVNVETDRVVNSLNTLGEEVFRWRALLQTPDQLIPR